MPAQSSACAFNSGGSPRGKDSLFQVRHAVTYSNIERETVISNSSIRLRCCSARQESACEPIQSAGIVKSGTGMKWGLPRHVGLDTEEEKTTAQNVANILVY